MVAVVAAVPAFLLHLPTPLSSSSSSSSLVPFTPPNSKPGCRFLSWNRSASGHTHRRGLVCSALAAISDGSQVGSFDPELRSVLELATDSELAELGNILFGPSYFSPLLKSIPYGGGATDVMYPEDLDGREDYIELLESRFLFLAADARSTIRGWRPSYRNVLLGVRRKLSIPCSSKLSTEDLEAEIFLHLLQEYSRNENGHVDEWRVHALAALKVGTEEVRSVILKGGGMLALAKVYQLLAKRFSGKMLLEAANYQIKQEIVKKGGKFAALSLKSRIGLLAARQGFVGAASRYLGLRSMMMLLGPMFGGSLLFGWKCWMCLLGKLLIFVCVFLNYWLTQWILLPLMLFISPISLETVVGVIAVMIDSVHTALLMGIFVRPTGILLANLIGLFPGPLALLLDVVFLLDVEASLVVVVGLMLVITGLTLHLGILRHPIFLEVMNLHLSLVQNMRT